MRQSILILTALAAVSIFSANAQDKPAEAKKPRENPIMAALDTNKDGVLDAQEINNAPAALRKLDKNGDGKITRDEIRAAGGAEGSKRKAKK